MTRAQIRYYSQATLKHRCRKQLLLTARSHQSEIASTIDLYKPITSQKVNRDHDKHNNRRKQTHTKATNQQAKLLTNGRASAFIERLAEKDWSLKQIHGWMKANIDIVWMDLPIYS